MSEAKGKPDDEHVEELLSQLQGIFGRLSHGEEEESQDKEILSSPAPAGAPMPAPVSVPAAAPPPAPEPARVPIPDPIPAPPPAIEMTPAPPVPVLEPAPELMPAPMPVSSARPVPEAPPQPLPMPAPARTIPLEPMRPAVPPMISSNGPAPMTANDPENVNPAAPSFELSPDELKGLGKEVTQTAVYFTPNREKDAKLLSEKLETLTPKFTKVAFQLKVVYMQVYDPKGGINEQVMPRISGGPVRAVFIIVERPLEEPKKRALMAELEPRGIYFQEVPLLSVEKKAFYTDLLLGMVFFFDSLKPAEGSNP